MRRTALALLVALGSPLLMGAGDSVFPSLRHVDLSAADRDALDAISAYMNGITTMKGNFIQVEPSGNVDEGRFYISKPGRMRFEYAAPVPTLLVADGSTVAVANTRLKTIDRYPIFETPLDVILSKSIDIRQWTVIDNQGLSTTVALRDVVSGGNLPASLFVLPDKASLAHRPQN